MQSTIKKFLLTIKKEWLNWILKLNHWTIFMMAIFLGVTGWLGCTAFSVPNLMKDVMDFAFPIAEIDAGAGARFILSRVIRGQMYQYHFLVGVIMYAAMIVGFVLGFTKKGITKNPITILFLISMTLLLISGWFRYYRGTLPIMEIGYYRGLFRNIHHYSAWALLWTSVIHIIHMIYLNATKYRNIISNMFSSGGFMLKIFLGFLILNASANLSVLDAAETAATIKVKIATDLKKQSNDASFKEAMKFYTGEKGFRIVEKEFPTCPYDACKLNNDRVEQIDKEDGTRLYKIKIHDWKSAKAFFDKSLQETNSSISAEYSLFILLERMNYKDKVYDDYLMKDITDALGIKTQEEYDQEVAKYLPMIDSNNSCKILYKTAEIYEKGFCKVQKNKERAQELFGYAKKACDPKSLYGALLKNK